MRTSNKLNYLNETKELIKEALREKGVEVSDADTFRSYVNKVKGISGAEDLSVELTEQDAAITELEEIANSLPEAGGSGSATDLDYIKYEDLRSYLNTGSAIPTEAEYEEILNKGYGILDYVFGG